MTAHELLIAARALIPTPKQWTKRAHARDATGAPVSGLSPNAVCLCSDGALWRAGGYKVTKCNYLLAGDALNSAIGGGSYVAFNDATTTTHADVLAMFDDAIKATAPEVTP